MPAARVRRSSILGCAALACAILASATTSWAQETRSAIFGTVKDASGGVLPGMIVVVTNAGTDVSNEALTNERGYFELPYLIPGTYRIAVQAQGFKGFIQTDSS